MAPAERGIKTRHDTRHAPLPFLRHTVSTSPTVRLAGAGDSRRLAQSWKYCPDSTAMSSRTSIRVSNSRPPARVVRREACPVCERRLSSNAEAMLQANNNCERSSIESLVSISECQVAELVGLEGSARDAPTQVSSSVPCNAANSAKAAPPDGVCHSHRRARGPTMAA
jgi:hypothetical protein